jgi:hypothetical protein
MFSVNAVEVTLNAFLASSSYERRREGQIMCGSMHWLLISIQDSRDEDGAVFFDG